MIPEIQIQCLRCWSGSGRLEWERGDIGVPSLDIQHFPLRFKGPQEDSNDVRQELVQGWHLHGVRATQPRNYDCLPSCRTSTRI